jgi:hypothetical protein
MDPLRPVRQFFGAQEEHGLDEAGFRGHLFSLRALTRINLMQHPPQTAKTVPREAIENRCGGDVLMELVVTRDGKASDVREVEEERAGEAQACSQALALVVSSEQVSKPFPPSLLCFSLKLDNLLL